MRATKNNYRDTATKRKTQQNNYKENHLQMQNNHKSRENNKHRHTMTWNYIIWI